MAEEEQHEDTDDKSQASSSSGDKHGIVKKPGSVCLRLPREYIYSNIFLRLKSHLCVGHSTPQTVVLTTPSPVGTVIVQCTYRLTDTRAFLGKTGEARVIYNLLSNFLMNLPTLLLGDQSIVEVTPGLT